MANSAGSKKRARQQDKRRRHNASQRSMVRTYIKKVLARINEGNYEAASSAFIAAQPLIDRMVNKGIMSKNQAARTKSRLNAGVKALKVV
ncbi:MAG: 30S ribosomal protein S20 [Gammaproteobacteria bacterium]|nr:MAG: 30S ribosomal protein S20 [Gammaproteobacteria bacterium]